MNFVNFLVHRSPFAQLHIQLLEFPTEEETDNDATLEFERKHRQFRETLFLMVIFQSSLNVITSTKILPKQEVTFTYYKELGMKGAGRKEDLHDWRGVVRSIFPAETLTTTSTTCDTKMANDDVSSDDGCGNTPITADEVITAMESYGAKHKKWNSYILRAPPGASSFGGCWHAEATLATMEFLSLTQPQNISLDQFRNTYPQIGVSKRCCPLCALLISLLLSPHTPTSQAFSDNPRNTEIILSYHQNIYGTALPRLLPERVAVEVLTVMERGVRGLGK